MMRNLLASLRAAALLVVIGALAGAQSVRVISRANLDTTCAPCTNFYQFANGGWVRNNTIPPDKTSLSSFGTLGDKNQEVVQKIVIDDAKLVEDGESRPGTNDYKIGHYYLACMDTVALDKLGFKPIKATIDSIGAAHDLAGITRIMARPDAGGGGRGGGIAPFSLGPSVDAKNSKLIILSGRQGGLVLNQQDYLGTNERSVKRRADYVEHIARSLALLGEADAQAQAEANSILALETQIAQITTPQADLRDPVANYNKMSLADFEALTPHFDWNHYLQLRKARGRADVVTSTPKFFPKMDSMLVATPVSDWQAYLRWHVLNGAMNSLSKAFRDEAFRWTQTTTGVEARTPRYKTCASAVNTAMGEAVGQDWIKRNFTPEAKARAAKMVDNLVLALRDRIKGLDWMSDTTKAQALVKLDAFMRKVAYPDKWRDYSTLNIKPGAYYQNQETVAAWNQARNWARLGMAPARDEWSMTPPTVNASYSPSLNQIQFPAGILQPPFFDPNADDAVNYGGLGAVIGHEMTHGFDDQGRQFDAQGNLRDWWQPADAEKYKAAAQLVVDQFNGYTVVDSMTHVNGRQTLGENIADLGGLTVAYAAMEKAMAGKPRTKIDGFTPEQRFFLSWAQIWRQLSRDQSLIQQVKSDAHAPSVWRVNGPLSNMPEFRAAWGCKEGDPMVRSEALRARIW
jgi:putative endopeptidase